MFNWTRLSDRLGAADIVRILNERMVRLQLLLAGVRRDGKAVVLADPLRLSERLSMVALSAEPDAPPAARSYLFTIDNGAGKLQLKIKYPSGAVVTLSTEP